MRTKMKTNDISEMCKKISDNHTLFGWKSIEGFEAWVDDDILCISIACRRRPRSQKEIKKVFGAGDVLYSDETHTGDAFITLSWEIRGRR